MSLHIFLSYNFNQRSRWLYFYEFSLYILEKRRRRMRREEREKFWRKEIGRKEEEEKVEKEKKQNLKISLLIIFNILEFSRNKYWFKTLNRRYTLFKIERVPMKLLKSTRVVRFPFTFASWRNGKASVDESYQRGEYRFSGICGCRRTLLDWERRIKRPVLIAFYSRSYS